ncbi:hypothetical protein HPP92_013541 [Vanilla planifolia]|uniref:F-box domain-containing protein n=1 Tax=Vanilla planifolia TaxID=51239 RepID=A0A835UYK4_VANPL|nr:hypothetical protein HPP92_013541 [Vanilla planifolia]
MESKRWEEMEKDCLVKVFMRLGLDDLTLTVPFVCKSWLAVAVDPLCWQKLDFRQIDVLPWSSFSKKFSIFYSLPYFSFSHLLRLCLKRSCSSVTELRFPLKHTSLEELVLASIECPRLKVLALPILSPSEEVHLPKLMNKWKHLQKLEMESKPNNFTEMVKTIGMHCGSFVD